MHQATSGPFDKKDINWASWAPTYDDHQGIIEYQNNLEKQVQSFKA